MEIDAPERNRFFLLKNVWKNTGLAAICISHVSSLSFVFTLRIRRGKKYANNGELSTYKAHTQKKQSNMN